MGAVFRGIDPSTKKRVAIKRLLSNEPRLVQMFEREFHALRSLQHPRIIEVYEYGQTPEGAYYSMELLDGADLRELTPLHFTRACGYLRDVGLSLGLIHARRMLHRDLSPRNVRVTSDDRAKLIDFGGMCNFGVPEYVVGTPPCVPPEALHNTPLDQRADLFALGALAYWLLTSRHAFPVRELAALPQAWKRTPLRPSEVIKNMNLSLPAIPAELDDLVMSLLTLNPLGRPATAADVIDRLEQIGGLQPDRDEATAKSYSLGAVTVGRDRERERLTTRLEAALGGEGSCIVVEAESGMGSTRLVSELTVEAQLQGALPLALDANIHRGPYGIMHALVARVVEMAKDDAIAAATHHGAILARFSKPLQDTLLVAPDTTDLTALPGELRKRTQTALSEWLLTLAKRRPLLIAVDNAQRMDDASAAVLATIASVAFEHPVMLVICTKPSEVESAPAAVRALHAMGSSMVLRGLDQEATHTLVKLLFGDVQHTGRLADWMRRVSAGNPRACMDLAEHIVDSEIVRFIQGSWVLPQEMSASNLPESLDALVAAKLAQLPENARSLAEALAVHRGALSSATCLALAKTLSVEHPIEALQTLAAHTIAEAAGDAYLFSHEGARQQLLSEISDDQRKKVHSILGNLLSAEIKVDDPTSMLDAGWHLLHGGDEKQGADLLAQAALELTFKADEVGAAVPALRAALVVYRRHERPIHEQLRLLTPLTMAGYYSDRRLADEFGEECIRLQRKHIGLKLAARLRPFLGRRLSLYVALFITGIRFTLRPSLGGPAGLQHAITEHGACGTALTGVATICLDGDKARHYAQCTEQLSAIGQNTATQLVYEFTSVLALIPGEHFMQVINVCSRLLKRLNDPRPIPFVSGDSRVSLHGGVLYALAAFDAFRANSNALAYANQLERMGLKLYEMIADQVRTTYHALRGEIELADHYRARVETHAVQAGSAWQAEVWVPSSSILVHVLTQDTIGLKRTVEQLDRLAKEIPSLKTHADLARAEYHSLKDEFDKSDAIRESILASTSDREYIGRTFGIGNKAHALNRQQRFEEARTLLEPIIANLTDDERDVVAHYANLYRELAHAYSGLGDHKRAASIINEMIARYEGVDHPLLQGNMHSTAAAIALAREDVMLARAHLAKMDEAFRPTKNPALIAQCEHMRREVRRMVREVMPEAAADLGDLDSVVDDMSSSARSLLSQCHGADERAQYALDLLLKRTHGRAGFLFSYEDDQLRLIAPLHGEEPQTELMDRIRTDISNGPQNEPLTVVTAKPARASLPPSMNPQPRRLDYNTHLLTISLDGDARIVGAIAVEAGQKPLVTPPDDFLEIVSRALFEAGDAGNTQVRPR